MRSPAAGPVPVTKRLTIASKGNNALWIWLTSRCWNLTNLSGPWCPFT